MVLVRCRENRRSLNRLEHVARRGWYVATREGMLGPFFFYDEAQDVVRRLARPATVIRGLARA